MWPEVTPRCEDGACGNRGEDGNTSAPAGAHAGYTRKKKKVLEGGIQAPRNISLTPFRNFKKVENRGRRWRKRSANSIIYGAETFFFRGANPDQSPEKLQFLFF